MARLPFSSLPDWMTAVQPTKMTSGLSSLHFVQFSSLPCAMAVADSTAAMAGTTPSMPHRMATPHGTAGRVRKLPSDGKAEGGRVRAEDGASDRNRTGDIQNHNLAL